MATTDDSSSPSSSSWGIADRLSPPLNDDIYSYAITLIVNSMAFVTHILMAALTLHALYRSKRLPYRTHITLFILALVLLAVINFAYYVYGTMSAIRLTNSMYLAFAGECFTGVNDCDQTEELVFTSENYGQDVSAILISVFAQSYLVYRCYLIWNRKRVIPGIAIPIILALIALGVFNGTFHIGADSSVYAVGLKFLVILPWLYWGLSLALNTTLTILIVLRLYLMRAKICQAFGSGYGNIYTGIAAMIYESSLLYTVVMTTGYLTLPGPGGTNNMFSPLLAQSECIASELIILRFALKRTVPDETVAALSKVLPGETVQDIRPRSRTTHTISLFPSDVASVLRSHADESLPPQSRRC